MDRSMKVAALVGALALAMVVGLWALSAGGSSEPKQVQPWQHEAHGIGVIEFNRVMKRVYRIDAWSYTLNREEIEHLFHEICTGVQTRPPRAVKNEIWWRYRNYVSSGGMFATMLIAAENYCPNQYDRIRWRAL